MDNANVIPFPKQAVRFEKKAHGVYGAVVQKERRTFRGMLFKSTESVRAIKESDGWRIDRSGIIPVWEAIDEVRYGTLREAKAAIQAWADSPAERMPWEAPAETLTLKEAA